MDVDENKTGVESDHNILTCPAVVKLRSNVRKKGKVRMHQDASIIFLRTNAHITRCLSL